jgi:methoxymalonate biosynthesis acyl carrier protein
LAIELNDVAGTIRGWLREHVVGDREVTNEEELITTGLLTSLQTVELVLFLDSQFGIDISDDEFVEENFNTVEAISSLVMSKRG